MKTQTVLKALIVALILNTITFTAILWGGAFLIHQGHAWVTEPRSISLPILGTVKLCLGIGITTAIFALVNETNR